jgi:Lrp/AsnC family transcriptional regulator for asnA, asnC and gidA
MGSKLRNQLNDTLDETDIFIIQAMQKDGRVAFAQIAQEMNVSPGMIRMRFNRLVELGVLKVVAISNPLLMGYTTMAMIGIRTDGERMLEVAEKVSAFDEVIYLIVVSGRFDIMCEVVCRDHAHLLQFLTEKLYKVVGVRESESFMHLKIQKEVYF